MKTLFILLASFLVFKQSYSQCSASIGYSIDPNSSILNLWADNFTGDTANTTFTWIVCDGTVSTGLYLGVGFFSGQVPYNCETCLIVKDNVTGCIYTICDTLNPSALPVNGNCSVYATYTPNFPGSFDFSCSSIGGNPVSYVWMMNFGLLSTDSVATAFVDTFSYPNGVQVCVTVTDDSGCVATDCIYMEGVNIFTGNGSIFNCQANFAIYPDTVANSNGQMGVYYGYNLSSGNYGGNVLWDFGDGVTSTDPYPVHTYATPGNYVLCLTVGTPGNLCYDTYCDSSFYAFKTEQNPMGQLTILAPTGIHENEKQAAVSLFPNPVSNELNLSVTAESLKVRDLLGREVLSFSTAVNRVDVSSLPQGMYVVEGISRGKTFRSTFIKGL